MGTSCLVENWIVQQKRNKLVQNPSSALPAIRPDKQAGVGKERTQERLAI